MNGTTHKIVGATTTIATAVILWNTKSIGGFEIYPWALLPLGAVGALCADVDMEGNPNGQEIKAVIRIMQHIPFARKLFTHRGFTHTLAITSAALFLAVAIATSGVGWAIVFLTSVLLGWAIGYLSHLGADLLNGKGVPLLWPVFWKKIHLLSISTGTFEEYLFLGVWIIFIISHIALVATGNTL